MQKRKSDIRKLSNNKFIQHFGEISKINKDIITVSLVGDINCEACKAKSVCDISNSNKKEIELHNTLQSYQLNETIKVIMHKELALKAVFFAVANSIGFTLAIIVFASIREYLELANISKGMKGVPINLLVAGLLSLAFLGFTGLV